MSQYRITSVYGGVSTTIEPDVGFYYTDNLNEINECELKFSSMSKTIRACLQIGALVEILRDSTREFYGLVDSIDYIDGGGLIVHASGYEIWLAKEHGAYSNSPWNSTASATIFSSLIGESTHLTAGTIATGLNVDFKASTSDSLFNSISELLKKTGQDYELDYSNTASIKINITDHKGSSTSKGVLNGGIDFYNLKYTTIYPTGNYVVVYGKGDGTNQIMSTSAHGQDITSQSTYGVIKRVVVDRTIISQDAANNLADKEVAISKDPQKLYSLTVNDISWNLVAGDIITITSDDVGLNDEAVRITQVKRGNKDNDEFLSLLVTNSTHAILIKDYRRQLNDIRKSVRDTTTYMQGATQHVEIPARINANNTYGLLVPFYVGAFYKDEAGNIRINSLTLDYDVDPYNRQFGTATGGSHDHSLTSGATAAHNHAVTDLGHDHYVPANTASAYTLVTYQNYDSGTATISSSSWTTIASDTVSGTFDYLYVTVNIEANGWSAIERLALALRIGTTDYIVKSITFNSAVGYQEVLLVPIFASISSTLYLRLISQGGLSYYASIDIYGSPRSHSHSISAQYSNSDNAYVDEDDKSPSLTGDSSAESVAVTIGDSIGEASSINATAVNIYLEFYDTATSAWVTKYSILSSSSLLNYNVDISNSGTYPDAEGWWRVRMTTNSSNADLIQAVVKIKHHIDS